MKSKEVKDLYKKFLKGECTEEEFQIIVQYFNSMQSAQHLLNEKTAFELVSRDIKLDQAHSERIFKHITKPTEKKSKWRRPVWLKYSSVAAAILLFIGLSIYFYNGPSAQTTYYNNTAKTKRIQLADHSSVHLRPGAKLIVDNKVWRDSSRTVSLTGEAFFAVHKDPKKPFIVESSGGLGVRVLGTRFYSNFGEGRQTIVLTEGSVRVRTDREELTMVPQDMVVYHGAETQLEKHRVDTLYFSSWIKNLLYFRDQSLEEVIESLNETYPGKNISIPTPFNNLKFTGYLPMDNVREAIKILERSFANHELNIIRKE